MSFDTNGVSSVIDLFGLNPFRAGRCLSTNGRKIVRFKYLSLNPFRAGRCLSTLSVNQEYLALEVSIPFEQGDVFRLTADEVNEEPINQSQSLSSRAMSFDR